MRLCFRRGSLYPTAELRCRRLLEAPPMLIPVLTVRRLMLVGLMLASLVVLADSVAQNELHNAISDMAFSMSGTAPGGGR